MIQAIIDGSIRNRALALIAMVILFVAGLLALQRTPLDAIPDLSDVQVIVFTKYPGQAPQV
ncbi:MAG: efflux RND transporter permease subunit, partial [Nitrospinota bacterium]|nr:efflux RND transporter permease subunit [Nitrospinota bacterium]